MPRTVAEAVNTVDQDGLHAFIDQSDPDEVRLVAKFLAEDRQYLHRVVAVLRHEREGLEALVRGMVPPNWRPQDVGGSVGLRTHIGDGAEAHDEASGLPPDLLAALRAVEALRTCAGTLEDTAVRLRRFVDREIKARGLPWPE